MAKKSSKIIIVSLLLISVLVFSSCKITIEKKRIAIAKNPVGQFDKKLQTNNPQFIILSFDGAGSLEMWKETRAFAEEMLKKKIPIKFTYFLSSVYLLSDQYKNLYTPPREKQGESKIGFAKDSEEVYERIQEINAALAEGHEIGSHLGGHFSGGEWTYDEWKQEFNSFNDLVFNIEKNNHIEDKAQKLNLTKKDITGFRAPNLSRNDDMYKVLKEFNFRYDTSKTGKSDEWPEKDENGIWIFPLVSIQLVPTSKYILSMDYNFFYAQSEAQNIAKRNSETWLKFYNQTVDSYTNYFNYNYNGERAPIFIGHHFADWNDGVYWEAMKTFAEKTCALPDVYCTTFNELANYLD